MPDGRYWVLDDENESNRLAEASAAIGFPVTGIVDEVAGGVIAYAHREHATRITKVLNEGETDVTP